MKMKILCIIMVSLFITAFVASFVGVFMEWEGLCDACEHATNCNVLQRARVHSIMTTIILGVCAVMWCVLLWDAYADVRLQHQWEKRITGGDYSHFEHMMECYENKK